MMVFCLLTLCGITRLFLRFEGTCGFHLEMTLARRDAEGEEICRVYRKSARSTVNWSHGKGLSIATRSSRLQ